MIKTVMTNGVVDLKKFMDLVAYIEDTYPGLYIDLRLCLGRRAPRSGNSFEVRMCKGECSIGRYFDFDEIERTQVDTIPGTLHAMADHLLDTWRKYIQQGWRTLQSGK